MANLVNKGLVIAAAVAAGLSLAGCASQGNAACGDTTATPAAAPAPMPVNACKNASSCKHRQSMHHHHHKSHTSSAASSKSDNNTGDASSNS